MLYYYSGCARAKPERVSSHPNRKNDNNIKPTYIMCVYMLGKTKEIKRILYTFKKKRVHNIMTYIYIIVIIALFIILCSELYGACQSYKVLLLLLLPSRFPRARAVWPNTWFPIHDFDVDGRSTTDYTSRA